MCVQTENLVSIEKTNGHNIWMGYNFLKSLLIDDLKVMKDAHKQNQRNVNVGNVHGYNSLIRTEFPPAKWRKTRLFIYAQIRTRKFAIHNMEVCLVIMGIHEVML